VDGPANRPPVLSGPNRASALAWRIADVQRGEVTPDDDGGGEPDREGAGPQRDDARRMADRHSAISLAFEMPDLCSKDITGLKRSLRIWRVALETLDSVFAGIFLLLVGFVQQDQFRADYIGDRAQ
jgi:hypothetical protein